MGRFAPARVRPPPGWGRLCTAVSSTRRKKSHYRGESPKKRYASQDPFAANEVKLLLNALAYNLVCVPLALFGLFPPWAAGLGMATSSLAVVLNAMRIARMA